MAVGTQAPRETHRPLWMLIDRAKAWLPGLPEPALVLPMGCHHCHSRPEPGESLGSESDPNTQGPGLRECE